jgi:hypothetical protein
VIDSTTLEILKENCYGHTGETIFAPLANDLIFAKGSSSVIYSVGAYTRYNASYQIEFTTLNILKASFDASGTMSIQVLLRSDPLITPLSSDPQQGYSTIAQNTEGNVFVIGKVNYNSQVYVLTQSLSEDLQTTNWAKAL